MALGSYGFGLENGAQPVSKRVIYWLFLILLVTLLLAGSANAQGINIEFADSESLSLRTVQLFILPPNMMIISLALFLTYFVMEPVFRASWETGIEPLINGQVEVEAAWPSIIGPFRIFMESRVDPDTIKMMAEAAPQSIAGTDPEMPLSVLVPSFLLSEIQRGFEVGFLVFLPFLIIDLVVAAVLMSMGMMMVPPAVVALPFKLAFFVVADGWTLLAGAMVRSYGL